MPDKSRKGEARTALSDRRSSPRYRTRALTDGSVVDPVGKDGKPVAKGQGSSFLGTTVNVSSGGALVRTYEALTAGQEVALVMHLPEGDLRVAATVLHVEQDAVGCRLAGVRFSALGDEPARILAKHLKSFDSSGAPTPLPTSSPKGEESSSAQESGAPRQSLRSVRERANTVYPFEGQVRRE